VNAFDILVVVIAGIGLVIGLVKGLVRILVGIAALGVAFVVASRFHEALAEQLGVSPGTLALRKLVAYLVLLVAVMLAGAVVAFIVRRIVKAAMLGWADRLGGAALGIVAAALLAAFVLLPAVAYLPDTRLVSSSALAPYVSVVSDLVSAAAPAGLASRYSEHIEALRAQWRTV
jgi:membrane protein required for colicin V production